MNCVECYKLIYDGAGEHEILGLEKSRMRADLAGRATSKRLAEYFLSMIRFDSDFRNKYAIAGENHTATVTKSDSKIMRQIDHIHEDCSREIREKWTEPQLTEEEVAGILYADKIEKELAKISGKVDASIAL